ncbi:hypothetical protein FDECE_4867 [Fusarium decemcellulare]|nr:hypothetical protein FDECE_4867 [Fusarium decemcellulare]
MGFYYSIKSEDNMTLVDMPDSIPTEGTLWAASDPLTFCGVNYCEYIFQETSTNSLDGDDAQDSDSQPEIMIPIQGSINQTPFMANTSLTCGAGCSAVSVFEVGNEEAWFYACNVSVGHIFGGSRREREVRESLRSIAPVAIALQGNEISSHDSYSLQYQMYQAESVFGLPVKGYASTMEMIVERFAIGTVAISAQGNPQVEVDGLAPVQGVHLVVDHCYANLILISIPVGHCSGAGGKAGRYSNRRVHRRNPGAPAHDEPNKKQHEE